MRFSVINLRLFIGCLARPRYWSQLPWRFVSLFIITQGNKMRDKWRAKHEA